MKDGNKESTKEMLGAFRMVAGLDLTAVVTLLGLNARGVKIFAPSSLYPILLLLAASHISCIYLFLLTIRKLADEEEDIIDLPDVKGTAAVAFLLFAVGVILLMISLIW